MSLLSKLWKKAKKSSQKSAKQAYKKKKSAERKQEKRGASSTTYDKVRQKASPTRVSKPSGNRSGGSSSGSRQTSRPTGWGAVTKSTTRPQNRQTQKKSGASGSWNTYAQNTFKSTNKASGSKSTNDRTKPGGDLWKAYQKGKSLNALGTKAKTRTGGGVKSKDLSSEDYLKLQNAGRNNNLKLDNKTAYKIGSRTAYAANRNSIARASHGFMQGMAPADVNVGPGKYNKQARKALKESKESTAGMVGYGLGMMGGFATGGTSGMAKAVTSAGIKAGAKASAKAGAKSTAKKFAQNRVAEMAIEAPMNMADAVKMAKDENGKVDKKALAGWMALNTGLTGGVGAAVEGVGIKFTKKNAEKLIQLQGKANKGNITKEEGQQLKKLYDKLNKVGENAGRADSNIAERAVTEGKQLEKDKIEAGRQSYKNLRDRQKAKAERIARTEADNARIDRGIEQWMDNLTKSNNAKINERTGKYASEVAESNRKYINDRELEARNADLIENGGTQITKENVPDTTVARRGTKANGNQAKSSKKAVRETLGGNHTPEAKAEIHESVDRMSNMINNGNMADARAEARRLARKHGKVETEIRDVNHHGRQQLKSVQDEIKSVTFRPSDDALKAVNSKGRIKDLKEAIGDYDYKKVHIQKGKGRGQIEVDEVWDEWSKQNPELFPKELTSEADRLARIVEVSEMKPEHMDAVMRLGEREIDDAYESIARDIYDEAERNARSFKDMSQKEIRKRVQELSKVKQDYNEAIDIIKNDTKLTKAEKQAQIDALEKEVAPTDDEIYRLVNAYDENAKRAEVAPKAESKPKGSTEDKTASAKAMKGTESAVESAEKKMQSAKNAKRNKDTDAYINKLKTGKSDDPVIPDNPRMADDAPEVQSTAPTDVAGKTISDMKTYSDVDKAFKISAKNVLENAPDRADELNKLLTEYKDAGSEIAYYKSRIKNNKDPKHLEGYKKGLAKAEQRQKDLNNEMQRLEEKSVSRYEDGDSVLGDINPTDSKGAMSGKMGKFLKKIEKTRRLWESSLVEFEMAAKQMADGAKKEKLLNAVNNVIYARNKAGAFISTARSSFSDRTATGKCLNDIFKDAGAFKSKEVRNDFNTYAYLLHHIDRAEKGKPVFMKDGKTLSIPDAKKAMESLEKKYDAVHGVGKGKEKLETFCKEITDYSNDLLKYRYDAGLISKEAYEKMLNDYKHYVPTYRIKDGAEGFMYEEAQGVNLDSVIKAAKGGEAPIEDLYSQLYKITNDVISNAEQNEMIRLYAEDMGFKPSAIAKNATVEDIEKARVKAGKGTITFYSDGKRVTLPANEHAVKGLREWTGNDYAVLVNACAKMGEIGGVRIFKGLITDWNVAFGLRNGARDFQQALVNSKDTWMFCRSIPSAFRAITNKNNAFRKLYELNGGRYFTQSGDPRIAKDPTKSSLLDKVVAPAEIFNGAIEMNPRMCEFIGTLKKEIGAKRLKQMRKEAAEYIEKHPPGEGVDKASAIEDKYAEMICNAVGKDTVDRAMFNAADITLNFSRHGAIGKALNAGPVPYFNPSIQGLSKTIRLFTEGRADKALLNIGIKLSVVTIAPSMANEIFMRNNRHYQDLNTRDKDGAYFIPVNSFKRLGAKFFDGIDIDKDDEEIFIKIPKPRENAALVEPFTYGLRFFFDQAQIGSVKKGEYLNGATFYQMFKSARDNIGPVMPHESNYFSPLINTARNKTWYGGNIESLSDQKLPVKDRTDEGTSAIANLLANSKALNAFTESNFAQNGVGKLVASNMSPKKIDNLMDSYFGIIYDAYIKQTAPNRNLSNSKYLPTPKNVAAYHVNQFILDGVYSNKLADGYYTKLDKLNKGAKEGEYTYKARVFQNEYGNDIMNYGSAKSVIFGEDKDMKKFTPKERQEIGRHIRRAQNVAYESAIDGKKDPTGTFEDNFKLDPFKVIAKELKSADFEKRTGKMPEEKVLEDFTYTNDKGTNMFRDALDKYRESDTYKEQGKQKGIKRFFNDTITTRGLLGQAGAAKSFPTWTAVSLVAETKNRKAGNNSHDDFAKAYGASDDVRQEASNYLDAGESMKKYAKTHKPLERMAMKEDKYLSDMDDNKKTIKLATKNNIDTAYYIEGKYVDKKQNYGRCIVDKYGMTSKEYNKWMDDNDLHSYQKGKTKEENYGKSSEEKVINAIEKDYKDMPNEFKAAMYRMFYDYGDNPYGEVGDYSHDGDKGLHHEGYGGYGGRGRRRRGRRHGRRGYGGGYGGYGGGGGAAGKDWNTYVGEIFDMAEPKLHDYTKPSKLNEAYRRRAAKKQMINTKS